MLLNLKFYLFILFYIFYRTCCSLARSSLSQVLRNKFLPPPISITQTADGLKGSARDEPQQFPSMFFFFEFRGYLHNVAKIILRIQSDSLRFVLPFTERLFERARLSELRIVFRNAGYASRSQEITQNEGCRYPEDTSLASSC